MTGLKEIQVCKGDSNMIGEPLIVHWYPKQQPIFYINVTLFRKMLNDIRIKKYRKLATRKTVDIFEEAMPMVSNLSCKRKEAHRSSEQALKFEIMFKQLLIITCAVHHCVKHWQMKTKWYDHSRFTFPDCDEEEEENDENFSD